MGRRWRRATSARDILKIAKKNMEDTRQFFECDKSQILSKFRLQPDDDPRLVSLSRTLKENDSRDTQLRHLLVSKYLAIGEEKWRQKHGLPKNDASIPAHYSQGPNFLRHEGLGEHMNLASDGLKQGQKCRRMENATGIEGISFALLPYFPQFIHLTRATEDALICELGKDEWYDVRELAVDLSPLARDYQDSYNKEVDAWLKLTKSPI
ncbi:Hypothetical protein PENO1_104970 [Penicillium occitanis (nom. inval.)]|nr:Hypothetical protein PENO1_104970 [Penicillium occitanis (nom. inval.)]PCG89687.1 hypothetical protein PENOC_105460 [Penicillium occitanis (nom. inval.)]